MIDILIIIQYAHDIILDIFLYDIRSDRLFFTHWKLFLSFM